MKKSLIYMVDGVPLDGSGLDYDAEDEPEWYGGTTIENLIPVEEPRPEPYAPSVFDEEEEERRIKREQVNDAYALAAAAWTDEERTRYFGQICRHWVGL